MSLMRLLSAGKTWVGAGSTQGRYRLDTGYKMPKFGSGKNPFAKASDGKAVAAQQPELAVIAPAARPLERLGKPFLKLPTAEVIAVKPVLTAIELQAAAMEETQIISKSETPVVMPEVAEEPVVELNGVERWAAAMEKAQILSTPVTPAAGVFVEEQQARQQLAPHKEHPVLRFLDWLEISFFWCRAKVVNFKWQKPSMPKLSLPKLSKANPFKWMPKREAKSMPVVAQATGPVQAELSLEKVRVMRNDLSDADLEIATVKPLQPKPVRREVTRAVKPTAEEPAPMEAVEA